MATIEQSSNAILVAVYLVISCQVVQGDGGIERFLIPESAIRLPANLTNENQIGTGNHYSIPVDAGFHKAGVKLIYCVEIKNLLDKLIKIERVALPCKCTKVLINQKTLVPGETMIALVEFEPSAKRAEDFSLAIRFVTSSDENDFFVVRLNGKTYEPFSLKLLDDPDKMADGWFRIASIESKYRLDEVQFTVNSTQTNHIRFERGSTGCWLKASPEAIEMFHSLPVYVSVEGSELNSFRFQKDLLVSRIDKSVSQGWRVMPESPDFSKESVFEIRLLNLTSKFYAQGDLSFRIVDAGSTATTMTAIQESPFFYRLNCNVAPPIGDALLEIHSSEETIASLKFRVKRVLSNRNSAGLE